MRLLFKENGGNFVYCISKVKVSELRLTPGVRAWSSLRAPTCLGLVNAMKMRPYVLGATHEAEVVAHETALLRSVASQRSLQRLMRLAQPQLPRDDRQPYRPLSKAGDRPRLARAPIGQMRRSGPAATSEAVV